MAEVVITFTNSTTLRVPVPLVLAYWEYLMEYKDIIHYTQSFSSATDVKI